MTITLQVGEVLQDPARFISNWRLAVDGALLLSENDFRIFHLENGEPDEGLSLIIDDSLAAAKVRETLPQPPPGGWWYFGRAMVEAWTRLDAGGWALHEVVTIWLAEPSDELRTCIKVRPHPWGWDRFL